MPCIIQECWRLQSVSWAAGPPHKRVVFDSQLSELCGKAVGIETVCGQRDAGVLDHTTDNCGHLEIHTQEIFIRQGQESFHANFPVREERQVFRQYKDWKHFRQRFYRLKLESTAADKIMPEILCLFLAAVRGEMPLWLMVVGSTPAIDHIFTISSSPLSTATSSTPLSSITDHAFELAPASKITFAV